LNSAKRYQPELQFAVASPTPEPSSVFYTKTPVVSNITPLLALNSQQFASNTPSKPIVMQPVRPTTVPPPTTVSTNTASNESIRNHMPMPVPTDVSSYKPSSSNSNSAPSSYNNNTNRPPAINVINSQPSAPPPFSPQKSDPIVLPLSQQQQQPTTSSYNNHHNHNEPPAYFHSNNNYNTHATAPYYHQQVRQDNTSPGLSLPLNPNNIVHNASSFHNQPYQHQPYPLNPPISTSASSNGLQLPLKPVFASSSSNNSTNQPTSMPLNKLEQLQCKPTNPFLRKNKPLFSNSVLSLKPDEEQPKRSDTEEDDDDDWDNIPVVVTSPTKNRAPTPIPVTAESNDDDDDDESEVDYSDMIYDRRNETEEEINHKPVEAEEEINHEPVEAEEEGEEEESDDDGTWQDPAVDPFADSFAVHLPKASTATSATITSDIKSPNKIATSLSGSVQILDPTLAAASVSRKKSTNKVAIEEEFKKEDKVAEEGDAVTNGPHQYEEKESEEIEVRPPQHERSQSSLGGYLRSTTDTPGPEYQHPAAFYNQSQQPAPPTEFGLLGQEEHMKVYPTNILKAGAPPLMSANNPYNKKQQGKIFKYK
jgi:hypothetical protein